MVVSSVTPAQSFATRVQRRGSFFSSRARSPRTTAYSSESALAGRGTLPACSNSNPLWMRSVASPPSSTICVGPLPPPKSSARSVHSQYSSSVSPFQANTGTPRGASGVPPRPTTTAAAA